MHVLKRGARGMSLAKDSKDKLRFVRLLCHMNDSFKDEYWEQNTLGLDPFERPERWPEKQPLVKILAWTLMPNHFHLLLKENVKGGISTFMQKLGNSMTTHYNFKYKEKGSIFQGSYKGKIVSEDRYLRWLASYIMVKNVFELYPGGLYAAASNFEAAWQWAETYSYSSFKDYTTKHKEESAFIDKDILGEIFSTPQKFKASAREMILSRTWEKDEHLKRLTAE
jgi:putative transposase